MDENKKGSYFKYAIGEVVLVVVGILIALQINNWNEESKRTEKGLEILKDVKENIESNSNQFQADISENKKVIQTLDILIHNITQVKIYHDSLDRHFRYASWWASTRWKSSGYESLVFHGADIIESKIIRESIIELYEMIYPTIDENTRLQEGNWQAILPSWLELIDRAPSGFSSADQHIARPFDYQKLLKSNLFRSFLTFSRSQRVVDIQLRENAIKKNQMIVDLIDKELY